MSRSRRPVTGGWAGTTGEKLGQVTHGDSARLDRNRASPDDGDLNGRGGARVSVAVDLMQPSAPGSPSGWGGGARGGLRQTGESAIRREAGGRGGTGAGPPRDTVFVAGGMLGRGGGEPPIQGNHDGPPGRHGDWHMPRIRFSQI